MNPIVAVDYDGTLSIEGDIDELAIKILKDFQAKGGIVILWTCRQESTLLLDSALKELSRYGFYPDYINSNAKEIIERYGEDFRKIYADFYIDDKSQIDELDWIKIEEHLNNLFLFDINDREYFDVVEEISDNFNSGFILLDTFPSKNSAIDFVKRNPDKKLVIRKHEHREHGNITN